VFVKLLDVEPGGGAHMLMRGQVHVDNPEPGRPVRVDLGHTAYRVRPGHRLRLHIASSDYPLFLWHPGTREDPWQATRGAVNEQTLATGGDRGSCVVLSVINEGGKGNG